jgi:hypothetical protein
MLFSNFEILIHIIKRWISNKFHGFNIGSIDIRWLSTTIPQYKCTILWFIIWPTNIFLFLWPSWPQNCSPQTEKYTNSVSVTNSKLWQFGCLKEYVAHPWDMKTVRKYSPAHCSTSPALAKTPPFLFHPCSQKKTKKVLIFNTEYGRLQRKEEQKYF